MGHLFIVGMMVCALASLFYPWVGVLYGYLFVVLTPQNVWWWDFVGWRATFWVLMPTCVGVLIAIVRGSIDLAVLRSRRNFFILIMWGCFILSYFFGPYVHVMGPYRFDMPAVVLSRLDKMIFFYFVACLCVTTKKRAEGLYLVVAISAVYLTYWAIRQYHLQGDFGRLSGPTGLGGGIYSDQNDFAMVFVVAQPFFWYLGSSSKSRFARYLWWLAIPVSWDSVFMTGSRGGFLGLATTLLLMILRSKRRVWALAVIPLFALVFFWKGGGLMIDRVNSIDHYHASGSAEDRLHAWQAAERMIAAHPLTGVGLGSFGPAFPYYSTHHPREAHDTLLQISAESGVLAGAMYALIVLSLIGALWRNGNSLKRADPLGRSDVVLMINEATLIGFTGLVVCSIFLSLQEFEIFYCLNVLGNAVLYLSKRLREDSPEEHSSGDDIVSGEKTLEGLT